MKQTIYLLVDAFWYMDEALKLRRLAKEGDITLVAFYKGKWRLPSAQPKAYARWGCTIPFYDKLEGKPTINTIDAIFKAQNKPVARLIWKDAGVPIPETWLHRDQVKFPCIVRQERHAMGQNFFVAETADDLNNIPFEGRYYYQEIYPNKVEYRAHVAGGKIVSGLEKPVLEGDLRRNAHVTGEPLLVIGSLPGAVERAALDAMEALGLDFGAVDIMTSDEREPAVLEVNASPGLGDDVRKYEGYVEYLTNFLKQ
jgi:glutathione synthase/RimK-type ligase-like ATP-grasp enzyme